MSLIARNSKTFIFLFVSMASKLRRVRKYSRRKRLNKHWFRKRMQTKNWRKVLARRRAKWRKILAVQKEK